MDNFTQLESNPEILGGKAVVKGTRISVEFIMELVATGGTPETIHARYPHVPISAIREAILFAASFSKNDIFIQIPRAA